MKHLNKSKIPGRKYLAQDGSGHKKGQQIDATQNSKLKIQNSKQPREE